MLKGKSLEDIYQLMKLLHYRLVTWLGIKENPLQVVQQIAMDLWIALSENVENLCIKAVLDSCDLHGTTFKTATIQCRHHRHDSVVVLCIVGVAVSVGKPRLSSLATSTSSSGPDEKWNLSSLIWVCPGLLLAEHTRNTSTGRCSGTSWPNAGTTSAVSHWCGGAHHPISKAEPGHPAWLSDFFNALVYGIRILSFI